jgi:hypothetical protein
MDDKLLELLHLKLLEKEPEVTIVNGSILNNITAKQIEYKITLGWDIFTANECDISWKAYRLELSNYLSKFDPVTRDEMKKGIHDEDSHWKWFNKSVAMKSDDYKWFFFRTQDEIQAVCLIYHPKRATLTAHDIFYIEFIAVAPWNRDTPMEKKHYSKVGTLLLTNVMSYCLNTLGYKPGLCLHSLPQAESFYEQYLGMQRCPNEDKDELFYYEMAESKFLELTGGSHHGIQ